MAGAAVPKECQPCQTSLRHGGSRGEEHPTSQTLLLISWPVQSGSHRQEHLCDAIFRSLSARVQARVEKSTAWVNGSERIYSYPLRLLSTEYALALCILGVNILVEPTPLYIKNAHGLELVQQPKSIHRMIFWEMATAPALGSHGRSGLGARFSS